MATCPRGGRLSSGAGRVDCIRSSHGSGPSRRQPLSTNASCSPPGLWQRDVPRWCHARNRDVAPSSRARPVPRVDLRWSVPLLGRAVSGSGFSQSRHDHRGHSRDGPRRPWPAHRGTPTFRGHRSPGSRPAGQIASGRQAGRPSPGPRPEGLRQPCGEWFDHQFPRPDQGTVRIEMPAGKGEDCRLDGQRRTPSRTRRGQDYGSRLRPTCRGRVESHARPSAREFRVSGIVAAGNMGHHCGGKDGCASLV